MAAFYLVGVVYFTFLGFLGQLGFLAVIGGLFWPVVVPIIWLTSHISR
jgi:hypothetical protein